jgi:hypothetical protein
MKQSAVEFLHSEYKRILKEINVSVSQAFEISDKLEIYTNGLVGFFVYFCQKKYV